MVNKKERLPLNLIYDVHDRITNDIGEKKTFQYCFTLVKTEKVDKYEVKFIYATVNDLKQKWILEPVGKDANSFRVVSQYVKKTKFVLCCEKNKSEAKLFAISENALKLEKDYEEVRIIIDDDLTWEGFPIQQASQSNLFDTRISWLYKGSYFRHVPGDSSYNQRAPEYTYLYDATSKQLIYIDKYSKMNVFYNQRNSDKNDWDWIKLVQVDDLETPTDSRRQWYFVQKLLDGSHIKSTGLFFIKTFFQNKSSGGANSDGSIFRNVVSLYNNDLLQIKPTGTKWGGWYTAKTCEDEVICEFVMADNFDL